MILDQSSHMFELEEIWRIVVSLEREKSQMTAEISSLKSQLSGQQEEMEAF